MSDDQPRTMTLDQLGLPGDGAVKITGISVDSRQTKAGHLFAALPGTRFHGAKFIAFADRMGAVAVVTDKAGAKLAKDDLNRSQMAVVVVDDPRLALAKAAALWFGRQPETMVAITGTNGKTSVASFTRQIWDALALKAVNFGTTGVEGAVSSPLAHTTPEPITLHALLRDLADDGVTHAAMEASSHGLAQRRLDGVRLSAAGFTNFTQDHLDYHADFATYFAAKSGLFERVLSPGGAAVINLDDEKSEALLDITTQKGQAVLTTGTHKRADLRILGQRFDATGQELRFAYLGTTHLVRLDLIGGFQGANVMVAAGLAIASGTDKDRVFSALPNLKTVRGRMQLAATRSNGASVFVDYAHTPDALKTALTALRPHVMGRLVVVFGAGGDRDRGKRPLMGAAAKEFADVVYVTDDNPRGEVPADIRAEVLKAVPQATEIGDRAQAILAGVDAIGAGDALLIAGKGHETGQTIGDDILPFDDVEQASIAVATLDGLGA